MYNENKRQQKFGIKVLILLASVSMIIGLAVGGTMAWLTDKTSEVKNTFTTSDINITLTETTGDNYQMIPGHTITKDPKVTVAAKSEKCYVFVNIDKSSNYSSYLTSIGTENQSVGYDIADGWTKLDNVTEGDVYYRIVDNDDTKAQEFGILKNNQVKVKDTVTKTMMNDIDDSEKTTVTNPTLTFTAYACQYYKNNTASNSDTAGTPFTADEAWANVSNSTSSGT